MILKACVLKPTHSELYPISLTVLFLLLSLFICSISGSSPSASPPAPSLNATICAVCESFTEPTCSDDKALITGNNFTMECELPEIWCFKSEGNITTKDHNGHSISMKKVERGCTKERNNEECVRIKQKDNSDFKVCYCRNATCNIDFDISSLTPINPNGGEWTGNNLWNIWWLILSALIAHSI
ncbi:hypothetical protein Ocin01_07126 [Orchesella cincta]|uniref:Protein sleepless n=1 Tax=Orchesella cincta TaxID=48709 RepID=A0A1D2N2P1_ORCCI|nr:hypothetical protein Ocin01_07126 [Orchesella cincta]